MKTIIAQALGVAGIAVFLFCFHGRDMKQVRRIKMLVDVIWGAHYFLLGAYSGFAINVVCFFREIVFLNSDRKFFSSKLWLYVFILLNLVSAAFTWESFYSLLPALTACIATYSFWQNHVGRARGLALTNNVLMFTYDIFVGSFTGLVGEVLAFASVSIAILRNRKNKTSSDNASV